LGVGDFGCMHGLKISLKMEQFITMILKRLIDIEGKVFSFGLQLHFKFQNLELVDVSSSSFVGCYTLVC
jgi:hypothetical protein